MDEKDIANIIGLWPVVAGGITALIGTAYAVVKLTKSKKDDKIVAGIRTGWNAIKATINSFLAVRGKQKK